VAGFKGTPKILGVRLSRLTPFEYGRIVLMVLCLLPAMVYGNTTGASHAAHASGQKNPYLVCEKGKRQSPINLSSSHHGQGHHTLQFLYHPMAMGVIHDGHGFKGLSDGGEWVFLLRRRA
jgi:hypothetical protein